MAKCDCELCKLYILRNQALESDDIEFVKKTLKEFEVLYLHASQDASYYQCIVDGSWPQAEEILTRSLAKVKKQKETKITKEEVLDIANKGNWEYFDGENRCIKCGKYQFEDQHENDCPVGALLTLVSDIF